MPEPVASEVVVLHLGNQDRLEWMSFNNTMADLCRKLPWHLSSEASRLDHIADHSGP